MIGIALPVPLREIRTDHSKLNLNLILRAIISAYTSPVLLLISLEDPDHFWPASPKVDMTRGEKVRHDMRHLKCWLLSAVQWEPQPQPNNGVRVYGFPIPRHLSLPLRGEAEGCGSPVWAFSFRIRTVQLDQSLAELKIVIYIYTVCAARFTTALLFVANQQTWV